ncbi:hypothetical protein BDZ91DRAFT_734607 [Kalaharituber pfeilii]|nr:hypothetical protein BDZ91DRAFT_734607 [Kalaharituber pfeilii]
MNPSHIQSHQRPHSHHPRTNRTPIRRPFNQGSRRKFAWLNAVHQQIVSNQLTYFNLTLP